jgi:hypothetical protein
MSAVAGGETTTADYSAQASGGNIKTTAGVADLIHLRRIFCAA